MSEGFIGSRWASKTLSVIWSPSGELKEMACCGHALSQVHQ